MHALFDDHLYCVDAHSWINNANAFHLEMFKKFEIVCMSALPGLIHDKLHQCIHCCLLLVLCTTWSYDVKT